MRSNHAEPAELWLATPTAEEHFNVETLSRVEADRYARMLSNDRRRDFAVSRALRHALGVHEAPLGRLSHSNGHAALLHMHAAEHGGVDLEPHAPRRFIELARFAYSAAEAAALERAPMDRQCGLFYALWTLKEAFAKALGLPLLEATRSCTFLPAEATLHGTIPTTLPWSARVFEPQPNLSLAVALVGAETRRKLRTYEWPPRTEREWAEPFVVRGRNGNEGIRE